MDLSPETPNSQMRGNQDQECFHVSLCFRMDYHQNEKKKLFPENIASQEKEDVVLKEKKLQDWDTISNIPREGKRKSW